MEWTKLRSWHLVRPGSWTTLCGRTIHSRATVPAFPADEKTCESCLRIASGRRTFG